jgi:hypothetical protein
VIKSRRRAAYVNEEATQAHPCLEIEEIISRMPRTKNVTGPNLGLSYFHHARGSLYCTWMAAAATVYLSHNDHPTVARSGPIFV